MTDLFAFPLALLLLPVPIAAAFLLPPRPAGAGALCVPTAVAEGLAAGEALAARSDRLQAALAWIAWALIVVALAGPQRVLPATALPASAREIVLVLDLSGSMERTDFRLGGKTVRRVDAVKEVAADFVRRRAGDRIGLVFFAEQAEMAAVPTFDVAAVEAAIRDASIGVLGRSTAIGDGLGLALKRLRESSSPSRVVVLLSDGTSTAGAVGPRAAADLARRLGIRVHTIALGVDETLSDTSGGVGSLVDTATLEAIAQTAGGQAFRVRSTEELRAVTDAIDALEAGEAEAPPAAIAEPLWPWPGALALAAATSLFMLQRRRP